MLKCSSLSWCGRQPISLMGTQRLATMCSVLNQANGASRLKAVAYSLLHSNEHSRSLTHTPHQISLLKTNNI